MSYVDKNLRNALADEVERLRVRDTTLVTVVILVRVPNGVPDDVVKRAVDYAGGTLERVIEESDAPGTIATVQRSLVTRGERELVMR